MQLTKESIYLYGGNLFFRGSTIGARFLFTLFLSKEFSTEILGRYSLFTTTILIFYFLLSFSFDSYSHREILQKKESEQPAYIASQFAFYLVSFLLFVPIGVGFFLMGFLPFYLFPYFLVLLALETLNQTFFSLFMILQKSVVANIILFFNQGFWIVSILLIFFVQPEILSFEVFLLAWIFGGLIAVIYAFIQLKRKYLNFIIGKIDWIWIRSGVQVSLLFFCSTLSYKAIEFSDRYIIEHDLGLSQVGIYSFFAQMANLISAAINILVITILYPKLIMCFIQHDHDGFLAVRRKMYLRIAILGITLTVFEVLFIHLLLQWLGKEVFRAEITAFYILLISNLVMNLSFIPHYCLYALKKDKVLLVTTLLGAIFNIVFNVILVPKIGISGAAISALVGFLIVWLSKSWFLSKNLSQSNVLWK